MSEPATLITVGAAAITLEIADTLERLQRNDNEDLDTMMDDIADLKRFLIHLNGSGEEAAIILGHLASIQYVEDALLGLKLTPKQQSHEKK